MPLYRGQGGAVFDLTPPAAKNALEIFEAQIANGDLVLVDEPKVKAKPAAKAPAKPELKADEGSE